MPLCFQWPGNLIGDQYTMEAEVAVCYDAIAAALGTLLLLTKRVCGLPARADG